MRSREFQLILASINQAKKVNLDTGGAPQRPILKPYTKRAAKKKVKGTDRVFPRGTTKISKEKNRGYSRSNTTGKDR